ncbi:hypothetical protein PSHT_15012 [Puccinia striiformis]|uniref:Uncharacterized protein n=2 Tax=Puccinia striiformis TaxID=27350 RepID=A0A2S4UHA2_9BASI|nr:hypothetical protein PSHT_15012 [Puccinia striiformis]POW14991.1 hypothetical protein PSTT_02570 [Puccinia striiformis]
MLNEQIPTTFTSPPFIDDNAGAADNNIILLTKLVGLVIGTAQTDRDFSLLESQDINNRLNRLVDVVHGVIRMVGSLSLPNNSPTCAPLLGSAFKLQKEFQISQPNSLSISDLTVTHSMNAPLVVPQTHIDPVTYTLESTGEIHQLNQRLAQALQSAPDLQDDLLKAQEINLQLVPQNTFLETESARLKVTCTDIWQVQEQA